MRSWFNHANVLASIPIFIAINLTALSIWIFDLTQIAMPIILGVIAGSIVDMDHRLSGRLQNLLFTLMSFTLSSLIVQFSLNHGVFFVVLLTLFSFSIIMLGVLGQRYNTIAFATLIVAIYNALTYQPNQLWFSNSLLILCGTILYSVIAIILYLFFSNRPVQTSIGNAFLQLSQYIQVKSQLFDPDKTQLIEQQQTALALYNTHVVEHFHQCRTALFYRLRGQNRYSRTGQLSHYFFVAQDIHERISSIHFDYAEFCNTFKHTDIIFRIQRLLELQAKACASLGKSLLQNKPFDFPKELHFIGEGLQQSYEFYLFHNGDTQYLVQLRTLLDNLQTMSQQILFLSKQNLEDKQYSLPITLQSVSESSFFKTLKQNMTFQSSHFRHAVRMSVIVFIGSSVIQGFGLVNNGYWILLTAVFVCQPNYLATKKRLKQRVVGTLLGVLIGSFIPIFFATTLEAQLGVLVCSATLSFFFRSNNYRYSTLFLTIQILISFKIGGYELYDVMLTRIGDTLVGSGIALLVSYLLPNWKYLQLTPATLKALSANSQYLLHIIAQLKFTRVDTLSYRQARQKAQDASAELGNLVTNINDESKNKTLYVAQAFEILQINSQMLGYISALGAFRGIDFELGKSRVFIAQLYPIARRLIYCLEKIADLEKDKFDLMNKELQQQLTELDPNALDISVKERQQLKTLLRQFIMMAQLLPKLFQNIQQQRAISS